MCDAHQYDGKLTNNVEQTMSVTGALLVLVAYAGQRFGRMSADSRAYLLLNFVGGIFLCWVAISTKQLGFIIMEGAWVLISLSGLWRARRTGSTKVL